MAFIEMDFVSGGGNKLKVSNGVASVSFTDGEGTLTHNSNFSSANDYILLWNFEANNIISVRTTNVDGNTSKIYAINYSGSSLQPIWSSSTPLTINWVAIERV